jgi:RNA polymerase sigma factor (sigma-70 family)
MPTTITPTVMSTPQAHPRLSSLPTASSSLAEHVASCIRRHLAGDREAMTDLTRHVRPWLHSVIRSYRLPGDADDDVVQSTLLVALLHIHRLRDPACGLSWLTVVARREALRVIRIERRYVSTEDVETLYAAESPSPGPEETVLDGADLAVVRRTVSKLPYPHRVLLEHMIRTDEPSYAAIAAALRMPVGSIGPTRRRGLERMRRLLAADPEWDVDVPA